MCPVLCSCGIRKQVDSERRPNACSSAVNDNCVNFGKYRRRKDYVGRWNVLSNVGKLPHSQVICADSHLWTNGSCSPNLFHGQNSYYPHIQRWKRCSGFEKPPVSDGIPLDIPSLVMCFNVSLGICNCDRFKAWSFLHFLNTVLLAGMQRRTSFVQRRLRNLGSLCSGALHNLNRTAARNVR